MAVVGGSSNADLLQLGVKYKDGRCGGVDEAHLVDGFCLERVVVDWDTESVYPEQPIPVPARFYKCVGKVLNLALRK